MANQNRSVLEVSRKIHASFIGKEHLLDEELKELVNWLTRRISTDWKKSNNAYDKAVQALAYSALEEGREALHFSIKAFEAIYVVKAKQLKRVKR